MNRNNNPAYSNHHKATTHKDIYQSITDYVLQSLESGDVIWQKGWNTLGLSKNIITGNTYRGWNVFLLNFITLHHHYTTPFFLTYLQAAQKGGWIKRGKKGIPVVYWATVERKAEKADKLNDQNREEEEAISATYLIPKTHIVFNLDQCEGLSFPAVERCFRTHTQSIEACEAVINNMPDKPAIEHGGDEAYYCPTTDTITLPHKTLFITDAAYYTTLFHELSHSVGHAKRLNRKELVESDGFGKESYSKEELTAELTAAYLCGYCGIEQQTIENSAAYIRGWLRALKRDKTLVLKAATQAQAAADYILGQQPLPVAKPLIQTTATAD